MSEQDPYQEVSAVAGPEGTPGTAEGQPPYGDPDDPYEKRYHDLRSWTDRVSQERAEVARENAALREQREWFELMTTSEDPDTRRQAAEALGYEFEEETQQPDPYEDPLEPLNERLARLENVHQQQAKSEQENEYALAVRAVLDERLDELMPDANEFEQNAVLAYAINGMPPASDGLPDLGRAHQEWVADQARQRQEWEQEYLQSKALAPHFSPNGQTATEVPNLDNDQERQDYMTRRIMANQEP